VGRIWQNVAGGACKVLRGSPITSSVDIFRGDRALSLETAGSLEEIVYARILGLKQRVYLYRIQLLIIPPLCLLTVLELI
jgi:hypothetical protein